MNAENSYKQVTVIGEVDMGDGMDSESDSTQNKTVYDIVRNRSNKDVVKDIVYYQLFWTRV